ncbi:MAG: TolC family protein, partial [Abditibacteriota bacterium]|nr:TolC family protein [Abditibacteriota bacterium]
DQVHLIASYVAPLYTGGKLRNSILASKEGLEAKKQKLESDTDKTVLSAAESYLLSLLTKALLDVNTEALETVKKHKEQAEIAYETGTAAKYDVIRAESAVKDREGKLYEAKANHESALMALKTLLNIDKAEEIELTDSLGFPAPDSDAETLIQRAENNNPGLKALSKKIKASEFLKKAESGSRMPQFSAIAAGQLVTGNINKIEPEWLFGVNMTFNIFDGGITGAKIDEAEHKIAAARLEKENAGSYLELGIRSALLRLEAAQKSLEAAQAAVALAREALRLAERRFETGNGTGIEVLDAQTALTSAEAAEKNALYKGEMIDLEIKSYCGLLRNNKENL